MSDIIPYQESNFVNNVNEVDPASIDAQFLDLWLYGKSEKTQRAYRADMYKFYTFVGKPL